MQEKLKQKIHEFATISKECPEPFQVKCFELLLSDYLARGLTKSDEKEKKKAESGQEEENVEKETIKKSGEQEDIQESDLHVKARQFLKKHSLSIDHINQLFYKEEGNFLPLYDDLKTTKTAESQIRVSLLHALLKGMHSGDFEFNGETVRAEVELRKSYDPSNFTANFKNNQHLFDGFDKYNKSKPVIRLSAAGKERLAEIIKELQ